MLAGEPDERLVALARDGDERAFGAIVERYRAPLLQYCRGFLPPSAAEDALQQTFINAHAALTREGGDGAPVALRPWLYRVAHNAALNVARDPQAGLAQLPDDIDGVERPDEALVRSERFRRVVGAVRALPTKQRQVIVRHALDGDSHEQIAADLGVSAGAIRQLAHRARRTVREAATVLLPGPLLRWLPWGANAAESSAPAAGGAAMAKVAVAVAFAGAASGGAVEVAKRGVDREPRKAEAAVRSEAPERTDRASRRAVAAPPLVTASAPVRSGRTRSDSSGRTGGSSGPGGGDDSSGSGSSGSAPPAPQDDLSGSGSSGSDSSGSGSSGSDSSGSGSSGSGSSGSDSSGSGSSGSDSSGSGSSGPGSSGSSGSGSSGSGSSGSRTNTSVQTEASHEGSDPSEASYAGSDPSDSSGSGSSGSGSSGSSGESDDDSSGSGSGGG